MSQKIIYKTPTGALISENDYSFLSDAQKEQCVIYNQFSSQPTGEGVQDRLKAKLIQLMHDEVITMEKGWFGIDKSGFDYLADNILELLTSKPTIQPAPFATTDLLSHSQPTPTTNADAEGQEMNDFKAMEIMSKNGQDIRMNGNVLAADKVKQGGKITFGVDADTFNVIINQMATGKPTHYVAIYVVNKKEFDTIKNK